MLYYTLYYIAAVSIDVYDVTVNYAQTIYYKILAIKQTFSWQLFKKWHIYMVLINFRFLLFLPPIDCQ